MSSPAVSRIAVASTLIVLLVAAALAVTIWSYRSTDAAHKRAEASHVRNGLTQQAETLLWHEREAMNEYLLTPEAEILDEVHQMRSRFRELVSHLEVDQTDEQPFATRGLAANEELFRVFTDSLDAAGRSVRAQARVVAKLNAGEEAVLPELQKLALLTERSAREREHARTASSAPSRMSCERRWPRSAATSSSSETVKQAPS